MRNSLLVVALLLGAAPGRAADKAEIDRLLGSMVPSQREEGIRELAKHQTTAVAKRLTKLLKDSDWGVQMEAIRAIAPIPYAPGRDGIRALIYKGDTLALRTLAAESLRDHDQQVTAKKLKRSVFKYKKKARIPGIRALGIIGTEVAVDTLVKLSKGGEADHRAEACHALGVLHAGEKALTKCLKDRKPIVRYEAALALAKIDTDSARTTLLRFLDGVDSQYVLDRAGRFGAVTNKEAWTAAIKARLATGKSPLPHLQVAIMAGVTGCEEEARELVKHKDPLVQAFALRLVGMGDPAQPRDLIHKRLASKNSMVRYAAAEALLRLNRKDPVENLRRLLKDEHGDVATMAVRVALDLRQKEVVPELLALAKGEGAGGKKNWMVRAPACVAAGWVGGMKSFDTLRKLAAERDWKIKAAALEGLFRIYDKQVIPVLFNYFNARHPVVRLTALKNLRFMTQKTYTKKDLFLKWWKKYGDKIELIHPEDQGERFRKSGYHVKRDMLEVLRKTDIVAILGRWDKVQKILEDLKIKHQAIRAQTVKEKGLNPKQVVLVNCEGSADSETSEILRWFVITGGYMATTDWAIVNALRTTFPGIVVKYGRQSTGNDVVVAEEAAPGHPVMRDVFRPYVAPKWWLEIAAFPLEVADPIRATVLVDSLQMLTRYGRSSLMVEFPAGLGKVMHSASHFFLQAEGLAKEPGADRRRIFAYDHLGMTMKEIRELDQRNYFEEARDTVPISKSYSMFHMLVNFIEEKRTIDLGK